jgi:5-dehydro-2-deoxygluconokinase
MNSAFDVIAIGRVGIDLYPLQDNITLDQITSFEKFIGGSATNLAIAAARHGLKSAIITRTGADPFGTFIMDELSRLGVSNQFVASVPILHTPIVFAEIFPPNNFPLYYYRDPKAPDLMIESHELDLVAIKQSKIFWSTLTGLSEEPSRSAHFTAWEARERSVHTILDLDYRPTLWGPTNSPKLQIAKALKQVSIVIGNQEECEIATGENDPDRAADALLEQGIEIAVVKLGANGVLAKSRLETVHKQPHQVEVLNGLGAGDSFGGAFCYGILQGWDLDRIIGFANVAGAINASRHECATAMPTTQEVLAVLAQADKQEK